MFLKILAALIVVLAALWLVRARRPVTARSRGRLPKPRAHDLIKCPDCGTWLAPGQDCACRTRNLASPARTKREKK